MSFCSILKLQHYDDVFFLTLKCVHLCYALLMNGMLFNYFLFNTVLLVVTSVRKYVESILNQNKTFNVLLKDAQKVYSFLKITRKC